MLFALPVAGRAQSVTASRPAERWAVAIPRTGRPLILNRRTTRRLLQRHSPPDPDRHERTELLPELLPRARVEPPRSLLVVAEVRGREIGGDRSEEHTSELQSRRDLVCRLL